MQGRELGCKTLGCGVAILIVLFCFGMMLSATEKVAKRAREKRAARGAQTAGQKLQAVAISVASYEASMGHLPPTTSPAVLSAALSPKFLTDTGVLIDGATGKPFTPNPAVSEKKRSAFASPQDVYLLASGPNAVGARTVLLLSGETRGVGAREWDALTTPRMPSPAPGASRGAAPSPVRSPR